MRYLVFENIEKTCFENLLGMRETLETRSLSNWRKACHKSSQIENITEKPWLHMEIIVPATLRSQRPRGGSGS